MMDKKGGIYYFTVLDFHSAGISVFYIAFFEIVAVLWVYGANRLSKNIYMMTGQMPGFYFTVCWYAVTPLFVVTIWLLNWVQYTPITYGKYEYSLGAQLFGWAISLVSIAAIPAGAVHTYINTPGKNFYQVSIFFCFFLELKPFLS
jgi:solute carrier family 6 GABA transporter-like protein 6/8/11/12/13